MNLKFDKMLENLRESDVSATNNLGIITIKGNPDIPVSLDERFRAYNSFVYLERYNGEIWEIIGTWGGSFETDKIYLNKINGITGIFDNSDQFDYVNFIRSTSKRKGVDVGDQKVSTYITGKSKEEIFLSCPGVEYSQNIVTDININMPSGIYTKTFTWTNPTSEFISFVGYVETPSKGRMIIKNNITNQVVWENMTEAEYTATGGSYTAEAIRDINGDVISLKTTEYVNVAVNPPAYLYQNISYTATLYVSEGDNKGDGVFPYFVVKGLESLSTIAADRDYVDNQVLSAGCYTKPDLINNGNNTVTLSDGTYVFYPTPTKKGALKQFLIPSSTYTLTNWTTNYIIGDYNGGTPIIRVTTDVNIINQATIIPIFTIPMTNILHTMHWDELANWLPNKILERFVKTDRFKRERGLILGVGANRKITISEGVVYYGVTPITLNASDSSVNITRLYYPVSGTYTSELITQYNNTQYNNGTNLVTLASNRYAVNWVYKGVEAENHTYVLLGTGNYRLDEAQLAQPPATPFPIT